MTEQAKKKVEGISVWVWVGAGLSIAYIGVLLTLVCALDLQGSWRGLSLNTLGDALAGAFAPLAFLWLFVATMVQSQELSLQRTELQESRDVSTTQANFIGEQTKLLMQEAERRRQEAGDRLLDAKVETYATFLTKVHPAAAIVVGGGHVGIAQYLTRPKSYSQLILSMEGLRQWLAEIDRLRGLNMLSYINDLDAKTRDEWVAHLDVIDACFPITDEARTYLDASAMQDVRQKLTLLVEFL